MRLQGIRLRYQGGQTLLKIIQLSCSGLKFPLRQTDLFRSRLEALLGLLNLPVEALELSLAFPQFAVKQGNLSLQSQCLGLGSLRGIAAFPNFTLDSLNFARQHDPRLLGSGLDFMKILELLFQLPDLELSLKYRVIVLSRMSGKHYT